MQLWPNFKFASGMYSAYPWLLAGFAAALALCYWAVPAKRDRLRASAFLFLLSLCGLLAAGTLLSFLSPQSELFLVVRSISLFIEAVAVINVASVLIFAVALKSVGLEPPGILQDLLVGLVYLVVAIFLLSSTGLDVRGVIATSAVISAVIGFSLQDTLANIMAGLALQIERTVNPGDWIRVDNAEGRVKETRWRQTSIETRDGDTIVIPNSYLMKNRVVLIGHHSGAPIQHRRCIEFNVDFRYPPGDVIEAVETAIQAERLRHVATTPKPHCLVIDYKDSFIRYAVRYWLTEIANPEPADSLIRVRIASALRRADIPLSIPAQTLFVSQEDEAQGVRKVQREMEHRRAMLRSLPLFQSLTEEEVTTLAPRVKDSPFVRGETLTHQGAVADSLFIIVRGRAGVHMALNGASHEIAKLKEGDFFGEMGLMTGEPRTASVVAESAVDCYRLDKTAFEEILRSRPEVAQHISLTLAQRRVELEEVESEATEEARRERLANTQGALLQRIRAFFGLLDDEEDDDN